jgi:hypothetical protein
MACRIGQEDNFHNKLTSEATGWDGHKSVQVAHPQIFVFLSFRGSSFAMLRVNVDNIPCIHVFLAMGYPPPFSVGRQKLMRAIER